VTPHRRQETYSLGIKAATDYFASQIRTLLLARTGLGAQADIRRQQEENMKLRSIYIGGVLAIALVFMRVTFAQKLEMNIEPAKHANLAAAQHHIGEALEEIQETQRMNKDELGGDAEKAIDLLNQANHELKEAEYADHK
jgi:hypothetical protein